MKWLKRLSCWLTGGCNYEWVRDEHNAIRALNGFSGPDALTGIYACACGDEVEGIALLNDIPNGQ